MDALSKAFADGERMYMSSKAAAAGRGEALLTNAPTGPFSTRSDLGNASEQYKHFHSRVYACVRAISQQIAGQPITVQREAKDGAMVPIAGHRLLAMLANPNELMTSWSLIYTTVANLELTGRCLWYVPNEQMILPIPSTWIQNIEGKSRFERFLIRPPGHAGEPIPIPSEEACYFFYPDPADPYGAKSPLQAAGLAVDADVSIQTSQRAAFANGIHPSVALLLGKSIGPDGKPSSSRPSLTTAQQAQIIKAVSGRYAGTQNHGQAIILDGVVEDVKKLSLNPAEMDWMQSTEMVAKRVYQIFGVNPIVLGEIEGANRASATAAEDNFFKFCINPKLTLINQCMTEWLGPRFLGDGLQIVIEPCVAKDTDLELRQWAQGLTSGCVTANEYRTHVLGLAEDDFMNVPAASQNSFVNGIEGVVQSMLSRMGADALAEGSGNGKTNGHAHNRLASVR